MFAIGSKLGVKELFYTHVGTYVGNGQVFHNHWRNGAEIISLEQFLNGKQIYLLEQGVQNVYEFWQRVKEIISARKPYNFLTNNCEHVVSYVREGVASSPQLVFVGAVSLIATGIGLTRFSK